MRGRGCVSLGCVVIAASLRVLVGCAARTNESGVAGTEDRILEELRRDGIPAPDEDGRPVESEQTSAAGERARAELSDEGPISLADLLSAALERNPSLAAARSEVGVAAGEAWQASLYPNPRLEVSSEEVPFRSGFGEAITTASIVQPIPLGDRLGAATREAEAEQAARRAQVELRAREVFGEIAQVHARLLAIRQAEMLYVELTEIGERTLSMAQSRFEARAAPETEVIRPQIELYRIELVRRRLSQEKSAARVHLSLLLGGLDVDVDRLAGEVSLAPAPLDLERLTESARTEHPSLDAADREIDAAAARLERIEADRVPDLDVRAGAGYKGETDDGIYEIGVGMTLPLWDDRRGEMLAARFALMRARQERVAIENDLLRRLTEAHGEYEIARAQLETTRDRLVPAALRSYEQTQEAYRGGRAVFLELLDAQRTLTEARAALAELSGLAAAARARIVQIVGTRFESLSPGAGADGSHDSANPTRPHDGAEVDR